MEGGKRILYTFSNEDLSVSQEAEYTKHELQEAFGGKAGFSKAMLPREIMELKESNKFFKALEDAAELLPKAVELIRSDKPFVVHTDMYEDGTINMYIDGRLVSKTKTDKDDAKLVLGSIRDLQFYN